MHGHEGHVAANQNRCDRRRSRLCGVVTGLPSHAPPGGTFAGGANDISFQGVGGMFVAMGLGNDPQLIRPLLGTAGNVLGTLLQVNRQVGARAG